jgi:hypothetical protein
MPGSGSLTCMVTWSVRRRGRERLVAGGNGFRYLQLDRTGEQQARVTVTEETRQVYFEGATIFGAAFSLIDDGVTITWLGHEDREKLVMERVHVPPVRFENPVTAGEPRVEGTPLPDGRRGAAITLQLEEPSGAVYRQRLLIDPERPADRLEVRLLELLLGDAAVHSASGYPFDKVAALLSGTGGLTGGTLELLGADGELIAELGTFTVAEVRREPGAQPSPVSLLGEDYHDLRAPDRLAALAAQIEAGEMPPDRPSVRLETGWLAPDAEPAEEPVADTGPPGPRLPLPDSGVDSGFDPGAKGRPEDDEPGQKEPGAKADKPKKPSAPPTTTEAAFGLLIGQSLLDDVAHAVNDGLGALAGQSFGSVGNDLVVDWLPRALAHILASKDPEPDVGPVPGPGTFLFCLAHDVQPPARERGGGVSVDRPDWGTLRGRGLLDREMLREAKRQVTQGPTWPLWPNMLPESTRDALNVVGSNWSGLGLEDRLQVALALLSDVGSPIVPVKNKISFDWEGLIVGELVWESGGWTLPAATAQAPTVCPLITKLQCTRDGIDGELALGSLGLRGTLNRRPGPEYLLVLAASAIGGLLLPTQAWILPLLAGIGLFLLTDSTRAAVRLQNARADFQVRFLTDNRQLLRPYVFVNLRGDLDAVFTSDVPTGIPQVIAGVLNSVANGFLPVMMFLSTLLSDALNKLLKRFFVGGFPAALRRYYISATRSQVRGSDGNYLYLESILDPRPPAPTPPAPPVSVRADAYEMVRLDFSRLTGVVKKRHYLSLVSSQNTLNILLAVSWPRLLTLPLDKRTVLQALMPGEDVLGISLGGPVQGARVATTNSPQLSLLRATPGGGQQHGMLAVDLELQLDKSKEHRLDWAFRFSAPAQVVVGSSHDTSRSKISILSAYGLPLDVLVDLSQASVQVTGLRSVETITRTETLTTEGQHGQTIFSKSTYDEEVVTEHALSQLAAADSELLCLTAARLGLNSRDTRRSPRKDGVDRKGAPWPADRIDVQTYLFDDADPDDRTSDNKPKIDNVQPRNSTVPAYVIGNLRFIDGLLLQHLSLAGSTVGALDPGPKNLASQTRDAAGAVLDLLGPPNFDPKV